MKTKIRQVNVMTVTQDEFFAMLDAQGVPREHMAFRCPMCGTIQSAYDLITATGKKSYREVARELGWSCVGRFLGAGAPRETPDGKPCNWTLEGLLQLHDFAVYTEIETLVPYFKPVSAEEAVEHMKENLEKLPKVAKMAPICQIEQEVSI